MMQFWLSLAALPVGIWIYLLAFRGRFWLEQPRPIAAAATAAAVADGEAWPAVVAVVPARNEAGVVGRAIAALLGQDYPGDFRVILVDDNSTDGTGAEARAAAVAAGAGDRLTLINGKRLNQGWTGKMWAVKQGLDQVERLERKPDYVLLTDADIEHAPDSLRQLVAWARQGDAKSGSYKLVSLMARLRTDTFAEKALIPAYVCFFQMLYPFAWINDPEKRTAGAAGGCMLVERKALKAAGGIAAIKDALIDDCALGRVMKGQGPVWLGLADNVASLRGYPTWRDIWMLIARSAFTQLNFSGLLLLGCVFGMVLTYLLPPLLVFNADPGLRWPGIIAWSMMTMSLLPTLYYYRRSVLWAPFLPLIALFYLAATIDSARRYWLGRGGEWKGRLQAKKAA
ncbi:MAG TPA: glycosyltransferase [Dongiaceae bacterium]|nr:glycosyltransferase [Dongiaceae bacterium]